MLLLTLIAACQRPSNPPPADTLVPDDTDEPVVVVPPVVDVPPPVTGPGYTLQASGVLICADPAARQLAPFLVHEPAGDWANQPFDPISDSLFVGGGLAVADFTGDGLLDVMLTSYHETFTFWIGTPGVGFVDATDRLPAIPERTSGVTAVDVDGDGDLDAYIATFNGPSLLLRNDGGWFTDVGPSLGAIGEPRHRWMSSAWADVDRDGDLDAFIAAYGRLSSSDGLPPGDPSLLLMRQEDGTYVDVAPSYGPEHPINKAHTFLGSFNDVDGDGWPDLFLVNDFGWRVPSTLLINEAGAFERVTVGVESRLENMGLGVADINEDGIPDFLVTAWDGFRLYLSTAGTGAGPEWFESAASRGLVPDVDGGQNVAWGAELVDLDNDTLIDAWVTLGYLDVRTDHVNPRQQPDGVWMQQTDGTFTDMAPAWGLDDAGRGRSLVVTDLNGDGWLDAIRTDLRGPADVLLARCGEAAWMHVELRQPGLNPFAIGARVQFHLEKRVLMRDVRAGGTGYGSGGPPDVHVGLGDVDELATLEITWPDGEQTRVHDITTRQRLRITREPAP